MKDKLAIVGGIIGGLLLGRAAYYHSKEGKRSIQKQKEQEASCKAYKEIMDDAVDYAEEHGWTFELGKKRIVEKYNR